MTLRRHTRIKREFPLYKISLEVYWLVTKRLTFHVGIEEARLISYDLPPMAHPPEPFKDGSHFLVYRLFSLDRTSLEFRFYYQERSSRFFFPPTRPSSFPQSVPLSAGGF
jgi:hypothetical protein